MLEEAEVCGSTTQGKRIVKVLQTNSTVAEH